MTKREAELLEHIIRLLTNREYQRVVFGWLPGGCDGPLWDYMQLRHHKSGDDDGWRKCTAK
jgi:hypothetical protein